MEDQNPWKTLDSEVKYDNNWIRVTEHQVINPSGGAGIYGEVHFKNFAIGILALDEENNTWLVGQYRFPLKAYSWEIPEGGGPLNEEPLESARRELLEETGLSAKNWREIQRMHLSNSVSDELAIIYLATGLIQGIAMPEETEQLVVKKIAFEEACQMVLNGTITDSMSVAAIMKVKLMILNGEI
ncbi:MULTISPECIES: NUDIX domain-containing protein [unclassified Pedobacter]|uniref:NUDIX domain-containing protein n=1 Tax=Pedobacter TaxID=84567 RepID=UPI000B4BC940|nr:MULTISPECIES: NUDIX hydrolase [unclassified Pedobacter]MCX2433110.1 NUDIX hydrolase [Pedobacter sp. GR22-10]MCX2586115.1 NUDIX hydrolase [Pedobacter sp. MR22-3]OWK69472.1 DNA mismatch repair protein MutT [Pedobacter sp. AJM]